jgi:hypothetical protein
VELKAKLGDLRCECDEFNFNLHNGVDQVREHCILLRNQVHLETEILIEEIHGLNEKLIGKIDKYEKQCVESFDVKIVSYEKDVNKILNEIDGFHFNTSTYLTEFIIDDSKVVDFLSKSNSYLQTIRKNENLLKKIKFSWKFLQFRKNTTKPDCNLLGSLVFKRMGFDVTNLEDMNFTSKKCASKKCESSEFNTFYWK